MTAPAGTPALALIGAVEEAGYSASVLRLPSGQADEGVPAEGADQAQARYLFRRLLVALAFYIPLTDVSVMLSLFPSFRFPGWQWLLVALAAPVAIWAAWPRKAAGHVSDLDENVIRDTALARGLVDVKVAALSHDWSALKLVVRVANR